MPVQPATRLKFGPFEVNVQAREVRRGGLRIRVAPQPFEILVLLLARPGEVVTREELRERIWRDGTFVDFDLGLNSAITKLRRALGDTAENPRYIETHPTRGYRFIGTVHVEGIAADGFNREAAVDTTDGVTGWRTMGPRLGWVAGAALIAIVLGVLGILAVRGRGWRETRQVVEFTIPAPAGSNFAPPISRQPFAISPDGTRVVFSATGAKGTNLWIRDLASLEVRQVSDSDGAYSVFWSPDSRSVFFSAGSTLKQRNLDTGATQAEVSLPFHAIFGAWRAKDDLLLYLGPEQTYELHVNSGALQKLPPSPMRWAQFLPDSDRFVHVVFSPELGRYQAVVTDFTTRQSTTLMEVDSRVQYAPPRWRGEPGYLLFLRRGSLLAQPFDAASVKLTGLAVAIAQNVVSFGPSASASFSVSTNGVLVYQAGYPLSELRWYDRAGRVLKTAAQAAMFTGSARLSPDDTSVVTTLWDPETGGSQVWIFGQNGKESRRLTSSAEVHSRPIWSPDGKLVAFGSSLTAGPRLGTIESAEGGKEQHLMEALKAPEPASVQLPSDWTKDGQYIAFDTGMTGEEAPEIWIADAKSGKAAALIHESSAQWGAAFSPDGTEIAFVSDQSGRPEVYVQGFDSSPMPRLLGTRRQVSQGGGWMVRWRKDGRELFYAGVDSQLYAVLMDRGAATGVPKALFAIPGNPQYKTPTHFQFDVQGDGQTFVMTTAASAASPPFTVIQNWQDKLHRQD